MILPLGFLEVSALITGLVAKHRGLLVEAGALPLRGPLTGDPAADVPHIDLQLLSEWQSARSALIRLRNELGVRFGKQQILGKAAIVALKPGEWLDWQVEADPYADAHMRLHVTLIPSESYRLFSGDASVAPAVGHILCADHRRPHSAVNFGSHYWAQLIVDVRRGDAPDLPVEDSGGEPDEPGPGEA